IINAQRTVVTTATRDAFVDVTGTDAWAVGRALNLVVTTLAEGGGRIESLDVAGRVTPDLSPEARILAVDETNRLLGTSFTAAEIAHKLERMAFGAKAEGAATVAVQVPCYRADILHAWDLIEDVAIGHGIDSFEPLPLRAPTTCATL